MTSPRALASGSIRWRTASPPGPYADGVQSNPGMWLAVAERGAGQHAPAPMRLTPSTSARGRVPAALTGHVMHSCAAAVGCWISVCVNVARHAAHGAHPLWLARAPSTTRVQCLDCTCSEVALVWLQPGAGGVLRLSSVAALAACAGWPTRAPEPPRRPLRQGPGQRGAAPHGLPLAPGLRRSLTAASVLTAAALSL